MRLGHARVLTVHRTVIHFARAASLRHPLQEILTFTVGAIHESPVFVCGVRLFFAGRRGRRASNDNNKTINQPVILSEGRRVRPPTEVELLRVERKRTSKSARHFCRRGIWLKISVACQRNVTSVQKPPKLVAISLRRFSALVLLRYSLRKTSTTQNASVFLRSE